MKLQTKILFLIFCLFSLTSQNANASGCDPVDIRSEFGAVRQQFDRDWCASFVLADLIGHKLKIRPPEMISAFDVAIAYVAFSPRDAQLLPPSWQRLVGWATKEFKGLPIDKRSGAKPFQVYANYVYRGRLCLESEIPSEGLKADRPDVFNFVDSRLQSEGVTLTLLEKNRGSQYTNLSCERNETGDFSLSALSSTSKALNDWWAAKISMNFDRTCSPNQKLKEMQQNVSAGFDFMFNDEDKNEAAFREKAENFLGQRKPFAISYDENVILNTPRPKSTPDHASIVVGRKWDEDSKTCKLLLRNSWGRECDGYNPLVECENGYLWIPENELLKSSKYIFKIE